jgi:hypothetical protein
LTTSKVLRFGLLRFRLVRLTRTRNGARSVNRFCILSRVGLEEEIVGHLFCVADASQDVHLRGPLCGLVQGHEESGSPGLLHQGLDVGADLSKRKPSAPQVVQILLEELPKVCFEFVIELL